VADLVGLGRKYSDPHANADSHAHTGWKLEAPSSLIR